MTLKRRRLARVIEIGTRRASYDVRERDFRGSGFTNFTRAIPRDPAAIIPGLGVPWFDNDETAVIPGGTTIKAGSLIKRPACGLTALS